MWISMTCGFYSVVQSDNDPTKAVVRARVREDLVALRRWVPKLGRIHAGEGTDYLFRCLVTKAEFARGLAAAVIEGLTYGNYKSAVAERDPRRSGVLAQAWAVFRNLEDLNDSTA